jgi:hypothetical protein
MQGAGRAAWPFPASDRQRRGAPVGAARLFNLLFLSALVWKRQLNASKKRSPDEAKSGIRGFGVLERIGNLQHSARAPSALGQAAVRGLHPGYAHLAQITNKGQCHGVTQPPTRESFAYFFPGASMPNCFTLR